MWWLSANPNAKAGRAVLHMAVSRTRDQASRKGTPGMLDSQSTCRNFCFYLLPAFSLQAFSSA
ncbi:MAG: hypothetical protein E5W21_21580, partial [Mesorhizobium sp.]